MAWLETKGKTLRIRFRYGGEKHFARLKTTSEREARESLHRFEENLRLIERGIIPAPASSTDLGVYILSAGKLEERPGEAPVSASATLGQLFDSYRERFPSAAKEESTLQTERIHLRHLERLLGANALLDGLTPKRMQAYATPAPPRRGCGDARCGATPSARNSAPSRSSGTAGASPRGSRPARPRPGG